jgi:hypothetical protein
LLKPLIAQLARCHLDRYFMLIGVSLRIKINGVEIDVKLLGQPVTKSLIGHGIVAPQLKLQWAMLNLYPAG